MLSEEELEAWPTAPHSWPALRDYATFLGWFEVLVSDSKEDDNLGHDIFSYFLLEGLRGKADQDSDGIITVDEVFAFLSRTVPKASGQDQHPEKKGEMEGELFIGRSP